MVNVLFSTCSRICLQQLVPISIFDDSQSLAYGILQGLCFHDCWLYRSGVSACKLLASLLIGVNIASNASQRNVDKHSSVNNLSQIITFRECFMDLTRGFHILPIQGLTGGLNFHFIPFAVRCLLTKFGSMFFMACFNSFEAPTKFVPLSDLIMFTFPLLEMNLLNASMNASIESSPTISRWTALVVKEVNRAIYLLAVAWLDLVLLESLMWYEPK